MFAENKMTSVKERILRSNIFLTFLPIILIIVNAVLYLSVVGFFSSSDSSLRYSFKQWQFVYTYQIELELDNMLPELSQTGLSEKFVAFLTDKEKDGWNIYIYNQNGNDYYLTPGISRSEFFGRLGKTSVDENSISSSVNGGTIITFCSDSVNDEHICMIMYNPDFFTFTDGVEEKVAVGLLTGQAFYIWLSVLVCIAVLILSNLAIIVRYNKNIITPLKNLGTHAKQLSEGDLVTPITYENEDEIGRLYSDVDSVRLKMSEYHEEQLKFNENRRIMISGFVHDLGTPLTKIQGYAEGLIDGIADSPEKTEKYIRTIFETARDMDSTLKQMSEMLRINVNRIPFNRRKADVQELIGVYADNCRFYTEQNGLKLRVIKKCREPAICNIDIANGKRAIDNIVANSIKYKRPDRDDGELVITMKTKDGFLLIEFSDNGIGIAPGDEEKIFEFFFRGDKARTNISEGSGMGLSIVKQIVEQHGGRIWARSSKLTGLTLFVQLPLANSTDETDKHDEERL